MSRRPNIERLRGAVAVFKTISDDARIYSLKRLARNNGGTWDLPSEARTPAGDPVYQPSAIFIDVFGVSATAHFAEDLPSAWIAAAEALIADADARAGEAA